MGNHLDFALKIAHRGNTGSHKGKRKLACLSEKYIFALLLFFSVFGLWHKANSAHFSGSYEKICSQIKKLTCNCSFSELTSHTTKAIRRPTALYFWEHYPSRKYLRGKSVEDLREELVPVSHNRWRDYEEKSVNNNLL